MQCWSRNTHLDVTFQASYRRSITTLGLFVGITRSSYGKVYSVCVFGVKHGYWVVYNIS
ncbi:hypothetical protein BJX99DRAFT_61517 [Aspergillus californicus]